MVEAAINQASLLTAHSRIFPVGSNAHVALISDLLFSGSCTFLPATDQIQTVLSHGCVTGTRIRFSSTVALPSGIVPSVDYFLINDSANLFRISNTLVEALAGTAINFSDAGLGIITVSQQPMTALDSLPVIVSREVVNPEYNRIEFSWGSPAIINGIATQQMATPPFLVTNTPYTFRHWLILIGGSITPGSTSALIYWLATASTLQSVNTNEPSYPLIRVGVRHEPA
jgi:hypothetical protein